jgi:hypothetical protein
MTVGNEWSQAGINNQLANLAIAIRTDMFNAQNFAMSFAQSGWTAATLQSQLGFSAADAATVMQMVGYLNNEQGVHFGTATVAAPFNFDNAFSQITGGQ